jgi:NAD(P)-dependent dehydrogenase (short-subunit alcohol dehydrogenase family)
MGTGSPAYRISKTALNGLTDYLNASFDAMNKKNIYTNSVCPGWVRTDLGGAAAPRSLDEGVVGILWLVQDEPDIRGHFIRDRQIIEF